MGFLDGPLRNVATNVIGLFTDTAATWTYQKSVYDSVNMAETNVERTVSVKTSPPVPVTKRQLEDNPGLLGTELVTYASKKDFDELSPPFDPRPATGIRVHVRIAGRDYEVRTVREYFSGDQIALLEFFLRG